MLSATPEAKTATPGISHGFPRPKAAPEVRLMGQPAGTEKCIRSTCILCAWGRREFAAGSPATDPTWDHGFEIEHGRHDRKGLTWVA